MIKKIAVGWFGGMFYVGLTWAATLTGILEWYQNFDPKQAQEAVSIFAPFSLMAFFLFASMVVYHQWQPHEKGKAAFSKLMMIGTGFAFGATATQLLLMSIDGLSIPNSLLLASVFFVSSLAIALLIASFYRFLRH
ncbi:MAG: hypothetical protein ACRBFS_03550 [Aureispira sp.]